MSTDITKGPRVCPSCGRENAATASHCGFCYASLDRGVQTTPPRPPPSPNMDASPFRSIQSTPLAFTAVLGIGVLCTVSFFITFVAVCFPVGLFGFNIQGGVSDYYIYAGAALGLLAGSFVAYLLYRTVVRLWRR